ncbi:hypothetical protein ACLD02_02270 [Alloalcanivorax sp. C16-2]|uniref:hypothetical protein n=1 Tax=Alloalcanivorax TaxID=3020832 RepID=UPI00193219AB|nr:hypothetical protein [Alloalcanivorax marinus]MBL7250903.1 hypothetical protein [Alloalcanivorax marinus]
MRTFSKGLVAIMFGAMLGLAGCDQQGPMEKAGEKADNAVDEVTEQGPMEEAGEEMGDAWDETKEAGEEMGEAMDGDGK